MQLVPGAGTNELRSEPPPGWSGYPKYFPSHSLLGNSLMTCLRSAPQQTDTRPSGRWGHPEGPPDELREIGGDSDELEPPQLNVDDACDRITSAPGRSESEVSSFCQQEGATELTNVSRSINFPNARFTTRPLLSTGSYGTEDSYHYPRKRSTPAGVPDPRFL